MISKKEAVEQFKRDLRSLTYYKHKRDELADQLLQLNRIMHEARSNRFDNEKGNGKFNYVELMEKEDNIKIEKHVYEQLIHYIGEMLERIGSCEDRKLLIDIYIYKTSYAKLAMNLYMSERNLKYHVDSIIRNIV